MHRVVSDSLTSMWGRFVRNVCILNWSVSEIFQCLLFIGVDRTRPDQRDLVVSEQYD